jgi:hypothetical protein
VKRIFKRHFAAHYIKESEVQQLKVNFQLRLRCACAATAMRERCDFHRSTIAIGNASIDYTVFIPLSQHRSVIAASHAHRSRNWKLTLITKKHRCFIISIRQPIIGFFKYASAVLNIAQACSGDLRAVSA